MGNNPIKILGIKNKNLALHLIVRVQKGGKLEARRSRRQFPRPGMQVFTT